MRIFFFNDTAPTEIYTLSLHDALPIWVNAAVTAFRKAIYAGMQSQSLNKKSIKVRDLVW